MSANRERRDSASEGMVVLGFTGALIGGIAWWKTSTEVNQCASTLVRTLDASQCALYGNIHLAAVIIAIGGLILFIYGLARP